MEKLFFQLVLIIFLVSTVAVTAIGQDYIRKNPDQDICVESRSCAINYMNKLQDDENQQKDKE